jgi:4-amino-4-deoxy-L-arabinose transferase-like glycosyltransferase
MKLSYTPFIIGLFIVYIIGWFIPVMDIDAAQYASMSRELLERHDFFHFYDVGQPYLDKPPMLFWCSAISMKIFGINHFAYRLPSFLFAILALWSTYKLALLFYEKRTAFFSALILASSQGFMLMNHDVRTDTILMGAVIFSIWQLATWYKNNQFIHLMYACIGIAVGMMTKGPIAILVPAFAFGTHFILQRNFRVFFKWQYIPALLIITALLIPMSIGLYEQFDQHPETVVNGEQDVSGLKFFFWTQSFGRITGASTWNNGATIFFLLQNMLWSFLPWIIFFLIGIWSKSKHIIQQRFRIHPNEEAITWGGFLLTYLSLGLSKYQLPHYIFVAFPFAAIITATSLNNIIMIADAKRWVKRLYTGHIVLFAILLLVLSILIIWPFNEIHSLMKVLVVLAVTGVIFFIIRSRREVKYIMYVALIFSIVVNFFLNASFYPALLKYQAGSNAGSWMKAHQIDPHRTFTFQYIMWRSLHFYAQGNVNAKDSVGAIQKGDYILTQKEKMHLLDEAGLHYEILHEGSDYPVSKISLPFLNPRKRDAVLNHFYLIKII